MASAPRVLVVDSDGERALVLLELLAASGFETTCSGTVTEGAASLARDAVDVVIVSAGAAADLAPLLGEVGDANVLVRTYGSESAGMSARSWGAYEAVPADAPPDLVVAVVDRAVRDAAMRREMALLRARAADVGSSQLIGRSAQMAQLRELIGRAAASQRTVLVSGEAGVGKDLVARMVHDLSERATRPYLLVRCTEASADALEEELFGVARTEHAPGRTGLLETARGGTVVFDECTSLSHALRSRLARAILERAAARLGDATPVSLDVRYVLMVREMAGSGSVGRSTGALPAGISIDPIIVPPLRERRSDIPLLVQHFRAQLSAEPGFLPAAPQANWMMSLLAQQWPGNVRELRHRVERDAFGASETSPHASPPPGASGKFRIPVTAPWTLDQLERRYIQHVLGQEHGNQSKAAERLGIDRRTLYRKLKEYRGEAVALSEAV